MKHLIVHDGAGPVMVPAFFVERGTEEPNRTYWMKESWNGN